MHSFSLDNEFHINMSPCAVYPGSNGTVSRWLVFVPFSFSEFAFAHSDLRGHLRPG